MQLNCPTCHGELELAGTMAHCATCDKDMEVNAACPECHQPLEVLKACGAVDYFCQHGHGLISKKTSRIHPALRLADTAFAFAPQFNERRRRFALRDQQQHIRLPRGPGDLQAIKALVAAPR